MVECEYCGDRFDGESDLLDHMGEHHAEELGPIDRRRLDAAGADEGGLDRPVRIGLGAVALIALVIGAYLFVFGGGGGSASGLEAQPLPDRGDPSVISAVNRYDSRGTAHVATGTEIEYDRIPPTSGTHYSTTVEAGFYEDTPAFGALVHSLEHGAVVIYYHPDGIDATTEESLRAFAATHTGTWSSVIVVPMPDEGPTEPVVLTAWRHSLPLDDYDPETVRAFLAEFLGRGPEHPVR